MWRHRRVAGRAACQPRVGEHARRRAPIERRGDALAAATQAQPSDSHSAGRAVAAVGDERVPLARWSPAARPARTARAARGGADLRCRTRTPHRRGRSARCRRDARSSRAALRIGCRGRRGIPHRRARAGSANSACLMSVSSSSWCCCSCAMPSSIRSASAGSPSSVSIAASTCARASRGPRASDGRDSIPRRARGRRGPSAS